MSGQNVIVRRAQRHDVALPARIRVGDEHVPLVRLSAAAADRTGWVSVDVIDFSAGGLGLMSRVFVPRRTVLEIQILPVAPSDGDETQGGAERVPPEPLLSARVRVQRVIMTDRRPAYLIGTSYAETNQALDAAIDHILELIGD